MLEIKDTTAENVEVLSILEMQNMPVILLRLQQPPITQGGSEEAAEALGCVQE